jgi:hypothetical protein
MRDKPGHWLATGGKWMLEPHEGCCEACWVLLCGLPGDVMGPATCLLEVSGRSRSYCFHLLLLLLVVVVVMAVLLVLLALCCEASTFCPHRVQNLPDSPSPSFFCPHLDLCVSSPCQHKGSGQTSRAAANNDDWSS